MDFALEDFWSSQATDTIDRKYTDLNYSKDKISYLESASIRSSLWLVDK
jgi:hypothetical protein